MAEREKELLPVPYFHVVFTIPHELSSLALQNKKLVYGILFQAAAQALKDAALNTKHLGAQLGFFGVLHTWGQNLMHHPHVHFIIPGGGLSTERDRWVHCKRSRNSKKRFFLPVRVLSKIFRGKFLAALKKARMKGSLKLFNAFSDLKSDKAWNQFLNRCARNDWVVYAKRPFGGPHQVLKYLARYTHRVAISNRRLIAMDAKSVCFQYKDYARGNQQKTMTLHGVEFMRRFLMHTLPKGFTKIRHFGFLSNNQRAKSLKRCRQLLNCEAASEGQVERTETDKLPDDPPSQDENACPKCKIGRVYIIEELSPLLTDLRRSYQPRPPTTFR